MSMGTASIDHAEESNDGCPQDAAWNFEVFDLWDGR